MAGRYEKVFSLPENLYATGSPVIIAAGALQKDTHTGKIFAQLKLQSISSGIIKTAAIQISLFDTASRSLSNQIEYQYLDVEIIYGQTFGEKILIPVEDNTARSFSVAVTEVIFSHQRIWKASDEPWETLPVPAQLEPMLDDPELLKQYQLRFSKRHIYKFIETKDLWRCSCGAWNHKEDKNCLRCAQSYAGFAFLDWDELKAEKDERLQQEAAERAKMEAEIARVTAEREKVHEELKAKKKIKRAKRLKIVKKVSLILFMITIVISTVAFGIHIYQNKVQEKKEAIFRKEQYAIALSLMDDGNYENALSIFRELNDYEKSDIYKQALEQLDHISTFPISTISGDTEHSICFPRDFSTSISYDYKNQKLIVDAILWRYPQRYPEGIFDPLPVDIGFIDRFISMTDSIDKLSDYTYQHLLSDIPDIECVITLRANDTEQTTLYKSRNGKPSFSIADKSALIEQQEKLKAEKRENAYTQLVQLVENGNYKDAIEFAAKAFDSKNTAGTYGLVEYKDALSYALYAEFLDKFWGEDPIRIKKLWDLSGAHIPKDFKDISWYKKQIDEWENSISNFCGTYRKADGEENYYLLHITGNSFELSWNQPRSRLDGTSLLDGTRVTKDSTYSCYVQNGKVVYAEQDGYIRLIPGQNTMLVESSLSIDMSEKNEFHYGIYTKIS